MVDRSSLPTGGSDRSIIPGNALTGAPRSPGNPLAVGRARFAAQPVSSAPPASRVRPKPVPEPKPPPGQEKAFAIAKALDVRKMSNAALAEEEKRFHWMRDAIGNLLARPAFNHSDVLQLISDGVKAGVIPQDQVAALMGRITADPVALHKEIADRYKFLFGALVQIAVERQRRVALGGKK